MKKSIFILIYIILNIFANSQNLVKINDYSAFYDEKVNFESFIQEKENLIVIYKNSAYENKCFYQNLESKNIIDFNSKIVDYTIDSTNKIITVIGIKKIDNSSKIIIQKTTFSNKIISEKQLDFGINIQNIYIEQNNSGLYLCGSYNKAFNIESFEAKKPKYSDIFILKLNSELEITDLHVIENENELALFDFKVIDNKIYLTGSVINKTANSKGNENIFFYILDSENYNFIKSFEFGSTFNETGLKIISDTYNNIYLSGNFSTEFSIEDSTFQNAGAKDIFLCKFNKYSEIEWSNCFGTSGNDYLTGATTNSFGDIYLTGTYRTAVVNSDYIKHDLFFNPFILKFTNDGKFSYFFTVNDSLSNYYNPQIAVTANNTILITANSKDINKNIFHEYYDCDFAGKIDLPENIIIDSQNEMFQAKNGFVDYLWSTGLKDKTIKFENDGLYFLTVVDSFGCVSMDSTDVFILKNQTSVSDENQITNNNKFNAEFYPNPAIDFITLKLENLNTNIPVQIFIFSSDGKIMYYNKIDYPQNFILQNIYTNINSGTYLLKIVNGENVFSKELVIIK